MKTIAWLFGVTLALCLFGAVMVFSASAVTAEQHYGRSYIFLLRQAAWLVIGLFGMFALMRLDYRRLREPSVVYTAVCAGAADAGGRVFPGKSHATHRWIKFGPVGIQPSELAKLAVILYLAWFLDLKRRNAAKMEFCKEDFVQTILPAAGADPALRWRHFAAAGPRHRRGHHGDRYRRACLSRGFPGSGLFAAWRPRFRSFFS